MSWNSKRTPRGAPPVHIGSGAFGTDFAGTPATISEQQQIMEENGVYWDPETYDCLAFAKDINRSTGDKYQALSWNSAKHYGVRLGGTMYGQDIILSKIGMNAPIQVTTGTYLRGLYGSYSNVPWSVVQNAPFAWGVQIKSF